jgi:hypothetical protein
MRLVSGVFSVTQALVAWQRHGQGIIRVDGRIKRRDGRVPHQLR